MEYGGIHTTFENLMMIIVLVLGFFSFTCYLFATILEDSYTLSNIILYNDVISITSYALLS